MWALSIAKKGKAVGRDGISLVMMSAECLTNVWVKLFNVCWKFGVVPSLWYTFNYCSNPNEEDEGSL